MRAKRARGVLSWPQRNRRVDVHRADDETASVSRDRTDVVQRLFGELARGCSKLTAHLQTCRVFGLLNTSGAAHLFQAAFGLFASRRSIKQINLTLVERGEVINQ